jgi:putative ferrous iron transport protein C
MILSQLRDYIAERRRLSLQDLANHFDTDPEALRGMLAILERKGRVRKLAAGAACGGCCNCDQAAPELYEWVQEGADAGSATLVKMP